MVVFSSNGDLIVQQRNCQACQYLEYSAMLVEQYCKETKNRGKRLYDTRGVVISLMANDLKDFVKGYIERKDKKKNYDSNVSASMIESITKALDIFGDVYNSCSCKKCSESLKKEFPYVFLYEGILSMLLDKLKANSFTVTRCDSASTSSIYLDIDYGNLTPIRVSDHVSEGYNGVQIILLKSGSSKINIKDVYSVREEYMEHDTGKVVEFIVGRLRKDRSAMVMAKYFEDLREQRSKYKDENARYQGV